MLYFVGVAGFEPATPSSRTKCATGLRYTPSVQSLYQSTRKAVKDGDRRRALGLTVCEASG